VPAAEEVMACEPFLKMEIAILKPKLIIALGAFAFSALRQDEETIYSDVVGKPMKTKYGVPAFVVYHPSPRNLEVTERRNAFKKQIAIVCALIKRIEGGALEDNLSEIS
jgi:DNA polymerase